MTAQDRAITAGLSAMGRFGGREITYRRGSESIEITAIKGRYPIEQLSGETLVNTAELTDWIFLVAELADLTPPTPQRGDWIEYQSLRFDVVSLPGLDCFGYSDPQRTWLRVHTVQTPVET